MKQKFTLHIADLQISVVTDATVEEVERISGILDRKMREIYLKSRCPKTEAALLCAMEFVADRLSQQDQIEELEDRCEKYALVLENLKERSADQAEELERLCHENEILRSLLSRNGQEEGPIAPDPISPTAFLAEVADAQNDPAPAPAEAPVAPAPQPAPKAPTAPAEAPAAEPAPRSRSRVGSMFDLLSFGETD